MVDVVGVEGRKVVEAAERLPSERPDLLGCTNFAAWPGTASCCFRGHMYVEGRASRRSGCERCR